MNQSIYDFTSASQFIQWKFNSLKLNNHRLSVRGWAKKLGFKNNAPISLMLAGKRPIPRKHIPTFVKALRLNHKETPYFEVLVELSHCRTYKERVHLVDKLQFLKPKPKLLAKEIEPFEFYEDPLNGIIAEMISLEDFKAEPSWFQHRLRFHVSEEQVNTTIRRLFNLGFLTQDESGKWLTNSNFVIHESYLKHQAVQAYHRNIQRLVSHVIFDSEDNVRNLTDEREIQTYTIAIRKRDFHKTRTLIWESINKIVSEMSVEDQTADEVYQLNMSFVPLTHQDDGQNGEN